MIANDLDRSKITPKEYATIERVLGLVVLDGQEAGLSNEEIDQWTLDDYLEAIQENYVDWDRK